MANYRITAENKNTHARLTLCAFGGREWFTSVRPTKEEVHLSDEQVAPRIQAIQENGTITIFCPTGPERYPADRFSFFGDYTALPHM